MLKKFSLYLNTIRFLRFSQIIYRIFYLFYKPIINEDRKLELNQNTGNWVAPIFKQKSILSKDEFRFLNTTLRLNLDKDWMKHHESDLWTYNLHYFDGLIRENNNFDTNLYLIHSWIDNNPAGGSVGWDAYPTSIRLVNWIKWMTANNYKDPLILESITKQGQWLSKKIEYHLSGNHLLANAKALIFIGLSFEGNLAKSWLKKGESLYLDELKEQVLDDGGHYERSPMYHSIILEDMLDIINASNHWSDKIDISLKKKIEKKIYDMINWLNFMTHPDGEVSFFNDSSTKIAPLFEQIIDYSKRLGIEAELRTGFFHFEQSGYIGLSSKNIHAIMDIGPLGPDHQSGHGHADTLSVEISLANNRVFSNLGTSQYGISERRDFERSTAAHCTLELENINSSETWGGFRVGRRANCQNLKIIKENDYRFISAEHDGYRFLNKSPTHKRSLIISDTHIEIEDEISVNGFNGLVRFHLHPDCLLSFDSDLKKGSIKTNDNKTVTWTAKAENVFIEDNYYAPEFGVLIKTKTICLELKKSNKASIRLDLI